MEDSSTIRTYFRHYGAVWPQGHRIASRPQRACGSRHLWGTACEFGSAASGFIAGLNSPGTASCKPLKLAFDN